MQNKYKSVTPMPPTPKYATLKVNLVDRALENTRRRAAFVSDDRTPVRSKSLDRKTDFPQPHFPRPPYADRILRRDAFQPGSPNLLAKERVQSFKQARSHARLL